MASVVQPPPAWQPPVGFNVNEAGAANFNIPIEVPPGTAGIAPSLSLNYSSQGGNGLLGMGWSLSGLSSIARCPQTMAQDGVRGAVNFDVNDRFCLDGQRLIAINGAYGAENTEYRTERESFSKIVSYGVAGAGPAYFIVKTKSGLVMEFGNTSDSRIEAQGKAMARVWALNKVSDVKGNYFSVTYTEDAVNGDFYPNLIGYTGNVSAAVSPYNSVRFVYEARPDIVPLYHAGSLIKSTVRLQKIQTYAGSALAKEYRVAYETEPSTQRPRVTGLTECDGSGNCLLATTCGWQSFGASTFVTGAQWLAAYGSSAGGWTDNNTYPRMMADVNGDGKNDVVGFAGGGVYVSLSTGASIGASTQWSPNFGTSTGWSNANAYPRYLVDVNGDGKADVVGFASNGVQVALSSGTAFGSMTQWNPSFGVSAGYTDNNVNPRYLADVNGDGLPDIVGFYADGVYVALNTGTSFAAATRWSSSYGSSSGWTNNSAYPRYVVDVDGDGKADIVGFASNGVQVALSSGTAFGPMTQWNTGFGVSAGYTDNNVNPRYLADVNGDGKPDVVAFANEGVYVALNTGNSFSAGALWIGAYGVSAGSWTNNVTYPRYMVDVNGDGKADIVGFAGAGINVSLSTGTSFGSSAQWVAGFGTGAGYTDNNVQPRQLADLNGDGLPDIVGFASGGVTVSPSTNHALPDLATTIASGLGATTTIVYKPLTDATVYTKDSSSVYPTIDIQVPVYVVGTVTTGNGVNGGVLTTNYKYGGLKADANGRGLLGLRWMEAAYADTGITARTEYRQDWPYVGLPALTKKTVTGGGNGGVLNQVSNTYGCEDFDANAGCLVAAGKRYFPYVSQAVETSWDLNGAALPTLTTTNSFDCAATPTTCYGNATQVVVGTSDGYTKTITNTYSNDAANWLLGRLTRSTVTSTTP